MTNVEPGYYARSMAARRICPELLDQHGDADAIADQVLEIASRMAMRGENSHD